MGNCPTCSTDSTMKNLDPRCYDERLWPVFLLVSFSILIVGWIILIVFYSFQLALRKWKTSQQSRRNEADDSHEDSHRIEDIKEWGNNIISGQTKMGKTCVTINFLCCIASLILYCIHTTYYTYVESCVAFHQSILLQIDFGLNLVFLVYFILKFIAAHNKRKFWFSLYSLVDIFTIPPAFVSVYLNRTWIGLRCLRALPLMDVPDILQYMGIIERPRTIRIIQLASKFVAVWFAAAGIVHLLENSGDFFCGYCNGQEIDLFNSVYFMIITMATVGYGDFSCKTYVGKTFVLICLMGGLAVFATMFPEFANLFASANPYLGKYQLVKGKRHVIICGHITPHSLALFLHDFLHKGREEVDDMEVVILDRKIPEIEMEALLKRYHTKLQYFVGSIMNIDDLKRVELNKARACLIIANKECADPASDDSANIMRVISLKSFNNRIRILIQLLQYHNKLNVASIPGWNANIDEIICIDELKLGLIGMSCVVPGFATMMTNIFRMSSYKEQTFHASSNFCVQANIDSDERDQLWSWRTLYHRGAGFTVFLVELPSCFYGKSFAESALICFKLRVMLLAVEAERNDEDGNTRVVVDVVPCDNCFVTPGSRAFLMCMSTDDVNRVKYYCSTCYPNLDNLTDTQLANMRRCSHDEDSIAGSTHRDDARNHSIIHLSDNDANRPLITSHSERSFSPCWNRTNTLLTEDMTSFDSTGMFYYTSPRKIEDATLDSDLLREHRSLPFQRCSAQDDDIISKHPLHFQDHIIVCIHADQSSPSIGLRNFVMPLRASSFSRHELPAIIFISDLQYISKEWDMLSTFPDIYILDGSPINPYNLKLVSVQNCRQCVIMSTLDRGNLETYLVDKSSALCALSIRQIEMKWKGSSSNCNGTDTDSTRMGKHGIRTLTALTIDSNVQYVEQGHTDEVDLDFFLTTPFASGSAFADSVLDCILSCAYYNNNTINLLRIILMGGIDPKLEEILAEGELFEQCSSSTMLRKRKRARIACIPITDLIPNIGARTKIVTYDTLFCESLKRYHIVVLGIYRLLHVLVQHDPSIKEKFVKDYRKRIVIYYPPHDYQMHPTDMVYVMQHSHLQDD